MNGPRWIPTAPEVSREAIAVIAGAVAAAVFFSLVPSLRKWVADRLPTANN